MTIIPGTTVYHQLKDQNRLIWRGKLSYYSYTTGSAKIEHFRKIGHLLETLYPQFFKDMLLGMNMFLKGKLKILPHKIKGVDQIKGIFERSQAK